LYGPPRAGADPGVTEDTAGGRREGRKLLCFGWLARRKGTVPQGAEGFTVAMPGG